VACHRIVLVAVFVVGGVGLANAACPGSTCSAPGGGSPVSDCLAEFDGPVLNYPVGRNRDASCVDGDAACDADGVADGTCHFNVSVCMVNDDDRFPACVPNAVLGYKIKSGTPGTKKFNQELLDLNLDALLITQTWTPSCTPPRQISVALKTRGDGTKRKGTLRIQAEAIDTTLSDRDKLKLICLP
jgi:hypothetical protein